ncbi:MAG: hypothetical protein WC750_01955 [Patescibacteria group bacterium]|jgi:hypothetical protein
MKLFIKDALWLLGTHVALAASVTLVLLMAIEWLMPGAVLPFVDVFDFLLPVSILLLIMLARQFTSSTISRIAQILLVGGAGAALLAILAIRVESYSTNTYALLAAVMVLLVTWLISAVKIDQL